MSLLNVSLGCLRTATKRCKPYPGVQGTQVKYPALPQSSCVTLGKLFSFSVCWCCPPCVRSVREELISEVLQTNNYFEEQIPNWEGLCKYCRWLGRHLLLQGMCAVYLLQLFLTWVLQEAFGILCRNSGVGDFLQLWTERRSSFLLIELKTDCGAISPFPKMNKHEQMPVRLHPLLCWRQRMWALERVWLDLGKTALIRALGGIWYHVHLRATEKLARVWGQVNLVHLHWRQWEGETVCSVCSLQLLMEKHLFWTSRPDSIGGSQDSNG